MKRIIYLFVALCATLATKAQSIESVKTMLTLQQYPKAKEELDKALAIDPSLLNPFTSVVVIVDNKPAVIEYQKKDRELLGFAIIKKPA
jgi:Tfp pilus assembly protein PilF